ncbi:MAG: DUF4215 domain-containing protein [Deltaproteobacteria bacterium]|nr:DUF4215 domain-containing protein [Deltaproteobacteria bacterium]
MPAPFSLITGGHPRRAHCRSLARVVGAALLLSACFDVDSRDPWASAGADAGADADGTSTIGGSGQSPGDSADNPTGADSTDTDTQDSSTADSGTSGGTTAGSSGASPVCGDGMVDPGEDCDDANADALDGCVNDCRQGPIGVAIDPTTPVTLPLQGNPTGGDATDHACPEGEVVIGIRGTAEDWLYQLRVVCGVVELVDEGNPALHISESTVLPLRGGSPTGSMYDSMCPPDHAVVGFGGRAGAWLDQLFLRCAPLTVADQGSAWSLEIGAVTDLMPVGSPGGNVFGAATCPANAVATISNIRHGEWIDAFGLTCMPISLLF